MDYYKILGVRKNATIDEIKSKFTQLAKTHHPDKNPDDIDKFKKITEAYKTLSDPLKRKKYDEGVIESDVPLNPKVGKVNQEVDKAMKHLNDVFKSQEFRDEMKKHGINVTNEPGMPFGYFGVPQFGPNSKTKITVTQPTNMQRFSKFDFDSDSDSDEFSNGSDTDDEFKKNFKNLKNIGNTNKKDLSPLEKIVREQSEKFFNDLKAIGKPLDIPDIKGYEDDYYGEDDGEDYFGDKPNRAAEQIDIRNRHKDNDSDKESDEIVVTNISEPAKKLPAKKVPAKKALTKQVTKQAPAKKVSTKKVATKQVSAKKTSTKQVPAKKVSTKKASTS
ncbi:DnaJ chaperone protein [Fadolivirus algeromassiliense]|jgi:curved DNA-binding protein CbpA|uniref:DnaJ chaperone protein n=1 Tax=Fadolivirus FV1/VV64 TaxID=3070911 RepID=A0A7D3QVK2_9VIRU|nr:DnaJ chaperone protein [Fadolivirus algeromassiliense]QKF94344.1 DnaJ chaperone protein [Fadolivirus FV1/VV64]